MTKRTAIYLRVSSAQQKLDSQLDELTRWVCKRRRENVPPGGANVYHLGH